jgi:hypothetical protein
MKRLSKIPILLLVGCLLAGLYGALHDQISYSVSSEYFTCFKFYQFQTPEHLQNRLGAALVGWAATWWMGIFIGLFVIPAGMIICIEEKYFRHTLESFAVVAMTAFVIGMGGLIVSFFVIDASSLPPWPYPESVTDKVAFARVGTMHNFSYLGGVVGIVTGIIYLVIRRFKFRRPRTVIQELG